MSTKSAAIIVIVLIILAALGYVLLGNSRSDDRHIPTAPMASSTETGASANTATPAATTGGVTISYGADGFSPKSVTVPVGTTVTWTNTGTGRMWVGSASHPTHTVYDGTSTSEHCANGAPTSSTVFDQCTASQSYSFTFTKAGTWNYHNHANASHFGSVTVTP